MSAKKRVTEKQVETASNQSLTDRRSAEGQLAMLISKLARSQSRLVTSMRRLLRKRLPAAHEVIYEYGDFFVISFSPSNHGYEGLLAIRASETEVTLCFNRGKDLPDPAKLLRGSGSLVRSMKVDSASVLSRPEVTKLLDEALSRSPLPFESSGRGSVIIRPTTASRQRSN